MAAILSELMAREARKKRCPPPLRALIQTWLDEDRRFNLWFLEVVKARYDEEPFVTMEDESYKAYTVLRESVLRYRSHPNRTNQALLIAAIQESTRIHRLYAGDWTPKKKKGRGALGPG